MSDPNPLAKSSNVPYVIAVVVLALLGTIAILVLTMLRPAADNTTLVTIILGFLTAITLQVMNLIKAVDTHKIINSDLEKWKIDHAAVNYERGSREGVAGEQARVAQMLKETVRVAVAEAAAAAIASVAKGETSPVAGAIPKEQYDKTMKIETPSLLVGKVDIVAEGAIIKPTEAKPK